MVVDHRLYKTCEGGIIEFNKVHDQHAKHGKNQPNKKANNGDVTVHTKNY